MQTARVSKLRDYNAPRTKPHIYRSEYMPGVWFALGNAVIRVPGKSPVEAYAKFKEAAYER